MNMTEKELIVDDCKEHPLGFLQEQWEKEALDREMYFSNGVKRYQYRTEEDKLKNCGRLISMYIGADGTQKEKREYRCRLRSCKKCMAIRANGRSRDFTERIEQAASEKQLFYTTFSTKEDQKRFRESAWRHGYEYLIAPTATDVRHAFVDGALNDTEPIHQVDAVNLLKSVSSVIYADRKKRVSGNLGKKEVIEKPIDADATADMVSVQVREYVFNGKQPTRTGVQIADVKAMSSASDVLVDGIITADNVQELITKRENMLFAIYRSMGLDIYVFKPVEKMFDLKSMNKTWSRIEIGKHRFIGNMNSLNPYARMLVARTIDEHNSRETLDVFETEVESAAVSISGTIEE